MSNKNKRAATPANKMQLAPEQEKYVHQFYGAADWLDNLPSDLILRGWLMLAFLYGRDAVSEEKAVSTEELDRFDDYVHETIRRCQFLQMISRKSVVADFSGEQPRFFERTQKSTSRKSRYPKSKKTKNRRG